MVGFDILATAAFGVEAVVQRELQQLGYESQVIQPGKVLFRGDSQAICRANLWLRSANRVLLRLATFPAADFGELFDQTEQLAWEQWLPADASFPVSGRSVRSQLHHVPTCQKMVKKAIAKRLMKGHHTASLGETGAMYGVNVSILKDEVTLSLDTSGSGLHRRGYRKLVGEAPLRETLAAAMIQLSYWNAERPFHDPFCGSGTIPIEAALIGRNLAPGLQRSFAAEQWPMLEAACWRQATEEARDLAIPDLPQRLTATDINPAALKLARHHAQMAGVEEQIHFQCQEFSALASKRGYGCLFANPPYGLRLGDRREVRRLYREIPLVLRRLKNWSHWILSADPDFEQLVGQSADRRRKLYNGRIECVLFRFSGPRPDDAERERSSWAEEETGDVGQDSPPPRADKPTAQEPRQAFGGLSTKAKEQAELFQRRLIKRARHLRRWPTRQGISCFRLYERDVPEVPLIVDRYGDHVLVGEYDRPHERSVAQHADWLEMMRGVAAEALACPEQQVILNPYASTAALPAGPMKTWASRLEVEEAGLRYWVSLRATRETGLRLDQRLLRETIRRESANRRCLVLTTGAGAVGVAAAAGGAQSVTFVGPSAVQLEWARCNLQLNQLSHVRQDYLQQDDWRLFAHDRSPRFDLAVIDFSLVGCHALPEAWRLRNLDPWVDGILPHLAEEGQLLIYARSKRAQLSMTRPSWSAREITRRTIPEDFRNRRIHRCWQLLRSDAEGQLADAEDSGEGRSVL